MGLIQGFRIGVVLLTLGSAFSAAANGPAKIQMRSEESRWVVEQIGLAADGWPELQKRATFPTQESAQIKLQNWQAGNSSLQTQDLAVQPMMASGVLWETRNQWSQAWEEKFGKWVETDVDADFFVRNNVATDCADVAYSLRWIFSRINGLPAAANIGGSSMLMTNETVRSEWAKLSTSTDWNKDKRFLKALDYLLGLTYTHTLWDDSFPVALNRHDLVSGSYHLNVRERSGHTQIIRWFDQDSKVPFITLNSTVPRKVRPLMETMLSADYPKVEKSGLLRFRWAVKSGSKISLKKSTEMPGYSVEQFSMKSQKEFTIALFEKMGYQTDVKAITEFLLKDISEMMSTRNGIVKEGVEKCKKIDCRPGTTGYEDWGTPSRDDRILGKISTIDSLYGRFGNAAIKSPLLDKEVLNIEGAVWPVKALIWNWKNGFYSSDPMDSEFIRWGAGNQSWVSDQKKFFTSQLTAREAHLKKSAELCLKQDCSLFSPLWSTLSSSKIDGEIRRRTIYLVGGDDKIPAIAIESLKSASEESVYSSRGDNFPLGFLLKNQPAMNASPLVSFEEQWGLSKEALPMPAGEIPYFEKWIYSSNEPRKILSLHREPLALSGELILAIQKSPILLLKDANGYKLYDLNSTEELPLTLSLEKNVEFSTSSDYLTQKVGENQTLLLQVAGSPLRVLQQDVLPGVFAIVPSANDFLISPEGELIDLLSGRHMSAGAGAGITRSNEKFVMTENSAGEKKIFDRATGIATVLKIDGHINSASLDQRILMVMKESGASILYLLDEKFSTRTTIPLRGFCYINGKDTIGCWDPSGGGQIYYALEKDSVRKLDFGQNVMWVTDRWICREPTDGKQQLIDRATGKVLFSGARISLQGEDLVGVSFFGERYGNLVNIKRPVAPLLSNVFPLGWWSTNVFADGKGLFLSEESGSVWLRMK
jgi:hypothetical protein